MPPAPSMEPSREQICLSLFVYGILQKYNGDSVDEVSRLAFDLLEYVDVRKADSSSLNCDRIPARLKTEYMRACTATGLQIKI